MRIITALIPLSLSFLLTNHLLGQTGPGGVGNTSTNFLWLDASRGLTLSSNKVTRWDDVSGNANHAAQATDDRRPLAVGDVQNGHPVILFDNNTSHADLLTIPDNSSLEGMNGLTGFSVYQLANGTPGQAPRGILSKRNAPDTQEAYAWFIYNSSNNSPTQNLDIDGTGHRLTSGVVVTTNTTHLHSFI